MSGLGAFSGVWSQDLFGLQCGSAVPLPLCLGHSQCQQLSRASGHEAKRRRKGKKRAPEKKAPKKGTEKGHPKKGPTQGGPEKGQKKTQKGPKSAKKVPKIFVCFHKKISHVQLHKKFPNSRQLHTKIVWGLFFLWANYTHISYTKKRSANCLRNRFGMHGMLRN